MFFRRKKIKNLPNIFPDEILLDSTNMPNFDTVRFEGKIEKPLEKKAFYSTLVFFLLIIGIYTSKVFDLQVVQGEYFKERSTKNSFKASPLLPERGMIYDREDRELAWNGAEFQLITEDETGKEIILDTTTDWQDSEDKKRELEQSGKYQYVRVEQTSARTYTSKQGLAHILGYIGYPSAKDLAKESKLFWEQPIGKEGLEKIYNDKLKGTTGIRLLERDSRGSVISENIQQKPEPGEKMTLSIDADVQSQMFSAIKSAAENSDYQGGAGIIMDVNTGELISLTSYPEYDPNVLSQGGPREKIVSFFNDKNKPFLNRAIGGLYAPGSIIKPAIALGALKEGIISPEKQILSTGSISLQSPYDPEIKSVFKDWKAHGWVDMREALSVSSDVYFYVVGGGYEGSKGLGIKRIEEYVKMFGFGEETGIGLQGEEDGTIPGPETKKKTEPKDPTWRVGDTYNASIGQGSFHITPIEMARYAAALANNGTMLKPQLIKGATPEAERKVDIPERYFRIVQEGMRMCVADGGTAALLNVPYVKIAAKTGTAELGIAKKYVNSWVIGYFPYENPKYAFALVMEKGIHADAVSASFVTRQLIDWMSINAPEYFE